MDELQTLTSRRIPIELLRTAVAHDAEAVEHLDDIIGALSARGAPVDESAVSVLDLGSEIAMKLPRSIREAARHNLDIIFSAASAERSA